MVNTKSMSDDFRQDLYKSYVSKFTETDSEDIDPKSDWRWYEYRYWPNLKQLNPEASILELGCGRGTFVEFLNSKGFSHVTGIDISEEQISLAKKRNLNTRVANVFEFLASPGDQPFDVILALDFLEHFTKDEVIKLLGLVYEALNKNGMFVAQTPNGQGLFPGQVMYDDFTHLTIFTPKSLEQILKTVGFDDIRFEETGPVPIGITGKSRKALWELTKFFANSLRRIEANKTQSIWSENLVCYCVKP